MVHHYIPSTTTITQFHQQQSPNSFPDPKSQIHYKLNAQQQSICHNNPFAGERII
jgi:hypothetical protein